MRRGAPLGSVIAAMVASIMLATAALLGRAIALAAPPTARAAPPPPAFAAAPPATLVDLRAPSDLRAAFNNDRGHVRLILLLSPTWPGCVDGARWVQQTLLDGNPSASVRVYAIWFNMVPGDARNQWRPGLLSDSRVAHFWDDRQSIGRLMAGVLPRFAAERAPQSIDVDDDILWDAYAIYGRDARWDADGAPPGVMSWGSTILVTQKTLQRAVLNALARP